MRSPTSKPSPSGTISSSDLLLSSLLLSSPGLSDTKVHEPKIQALLETGSQFCEALVLQLGTRSLSSDRETTADLDHTQRKP